VASVHAATSRNSAATRRWDDIGIFYSTNRNCALYSYLSPGRPNFLPKMPDKPMRDPGAGGMRAAMIFGVVAATIEMAVVLWMMYC
jgi:hypothetical protein